MRNLLLTLAATAIVTSSQATLINPTHYTGPSDGISRPDNSSPGEELAFMELKLGISDLTFLGKINPDGSIDEDPLNLFADSKIIIDNFQVPGDEETFDIEWDLTGIQLAGKNLTLEAVFIKAGSQGDTSWVTDNAQKNAGGPQNIYWNTPATENGSISHVSLFGRYAGPGEPGGPPTGGPVPDGGATAAFLGIGVLGLAASRKFLK